MVNFSSITFPDFNSIKEGIVSFVSTQYQSFQSIDWSARGAVVWASAQQLFTQGYEFGSRYLNKENAEFLISKSASLISQNPKTSIALIACAAAVIFRKTICSVLPRVTYETSQEARVAELETEIEGSKAENRILNSSIDEKNDAIKELQDANLRLREEQVKLQGSCDTAQREVVNLTKVVGDRDLEIETLTRQLSAFNQEVQRLNQELTRLNDLNQQYVSALQTFSAAYGAEDASEEGKLRAVASLLQGLEALGVVEETDS